MRFCVIATGVAIGAVLAGAPAQAQQNGSQPVESGTPWSPEELPITTVFDYGRGDRADAGLRAPGSIAPSRWRPARPFQTTDANDEHWSVTPTTYGAGTFAKPVILVHAPGRRALATKLVISSVAVNQQARAYKIKLVSDAAQYTHPRGLSLPDRAVGIDQAAVRCRAAGSVKATRVPCFGVLSMVRWPPCNSTRPLASGRPRPGALLVARHRVLPPGRRAAGAILDLMRRHADFRYRRRRIEPRRSAVR